MKDEHDKRTLELMPSANTSELGAAGGSAAHPRRDQLGKSKRLSHQSIYKPPEGAKPELTGLSLGFGRSVVPVSAVARDWGISARRVRLMLTEGRLNGRQLENGYWEVYYPYSYIFGTRGPAIKRQRKQEGKSE